MRITMPHPRWPRRSATPRNRRRAAGKEPSRSPATPLTAVIDLAQSGGQWIGSATVPGIHPKGAQLTDIVVQAPAVSFTMKGALGDPKFSGRLEADGTLAGEFRAGGKHRRVAAAKSRTAAGRSAAAEHRGRAGTGRRVAGRGDARREQAEGHAEAGEPGRGKATAQFVVIGKRETNIPIDLVRQEGDFLTLVCSAVPHDLRRAARARTRRN